MTNTSGRDAVLEKLMLLDWLRAGTPAKDLEVWPLPRSTGDFCLCVNFLPMDNNQSEGMIRIAFANLIERRFTQQFAALQFAVSKPLADPTRNEVVARYFIDDKRLREIERDPMLISNTTLETLVTRKVTK